MKIIHNIKLPLTAGNQDAIQAAAKTVGLPKTTPGQVRKEALDCRKGNAFKIYSVVLDTDKNHPLLKEYLPYSFSPPTLPDASLKPYIIGAGPAGLFCALTLLDFGVKPIIIERGQTVQERTKKVENFWQGGALDPESNVQFGEGGAGTFSDGKLTTRINDPRCRRVLEMFAEHGAPQEILTKAKAHIGTDLLRKVIVNIRKDILARGGQFHFETRMDDLEIRNGKIAAVTLNGEKTAAGPVVLAIGNGALDTFETLLKKPLHFETKPMAFGIRQEHLQEEINRARYGRLPDKVREFLPPADYAFYTHLTPEICVYTFCMCPGGSVVNASSLPGRITINGMSLHARNGENANSALLVSFRPKNIRQALEIQKLIEKNAFVTGEGQVPVTGSLDKAENLTGVKPTVMPSTKTVDFSKIFPNDMLTSLRNGARFFTKEILKDGKVTPPAYTAPETRSSSPLRILRDPQTLQALGAEGLYPCGEGAGYAGGIISSATDGIRVAEQILSAGKRS